MSSKPARKDSKSSKNTPWTAPPSGAKEKTNTNTGDKSPDYTLLVLCDEIAEMPDGRITALPKELSAFENLRRALEKDQGLTGGDLKLYTQIGSYQADFSWGLRQAVLIDDFGAAESLVCGLEEQIAVLKANATLTHPKTARELGISKSRIGVLTSLAEISSLGLTTAVMRRADRCCFELPVLDRMALAALRIADPEVTRVHGRVTAVGVYEGPGCRIEINGGTMLIVANVPLADAVQYLLSSEYVSGAQRKENKDYYLDDFLLTPAPQQKLDI
jgi:hypothetical protein